MIIGGRNSNLSRALSHALSFIRVYSMVGTALVVLAGLLWGDTEMGNLTWLMLLAHFTAIIVLLPAAVAANFAALLAFRRRSWRQDRWRAWVAGTLAVPFIWGGMAAWESFLHGPPVMLNRFGAWSVTAYLLGVVVLFSNLAILIGWLLPSRWAPAPSRLR